MKPEMSEVQTSDLASPCGLQGNAPDAGVRVLFLDVDGVLNSHRTVITSGNCAHPHNYAERRAMFDWTAITMLQGLCRVADLRVVLSSSWRCGMSKDELAKFGAFLGLPIIDMTPQTWIPHQTRGYEIQEWLDDHVEVTHYAIVDDDCDMLPEQMTRYVQTFYEDGLTWAPFSKLCDMFSVSPFACAVERVGEATPASSSPDEKQDAAALQVIPEDFITHRDSWRRGLKFCRDSCFMDDEAYWQHELDAFDRAHAELAALQVPAGWVLVPVEPTWDMCEAGRALVDREFTFPEDIYRAMLAARPAAGSQNDTGAKS